MKENIKKDDQSCAQKKDSEKLAAIRKSEKAGDLKISVAKKDAIGQAINEARNQTTGPAPSTSNQALVSVYQSLQNDFIISKAMNLHRVLPARPMDVNAMTPSDALNIQQSSSTTQSSMRNNLVSNTMNSSQSATAVEQMEEGNTFDDFLNVLQIEMKNNNPAPIPPVQYIRPVEAETSNTSSSVAKSKKQRKAKAMANKTPPAVPGKKMRKRLRLLESHFKNLEKSNNRNIQSLPEFGRLNPLICAIVEEQYPYMPPLTEIHLGIIRNVIKGKIDELSFEFFVPKFINAFLKSGVILVECADNQSKDWLEIALSNYSPEAGIYLKVIPAHAVNHFYPASIFVPDEANAMDVLRRIQKQNSDISIRNWQYRSMIIVKESTPGIVINVNIPATSVARLKEKNFKLFHSMDQVTIIMNNSIPF